jgi:hypothetical protein
VTSAIIAPHTMGQLDDLLAAIGGQGETGGGFALRDPQTAAARGDRSAAPGCVGNRTIDEETDQDPRSPDRTRPATC